MIIVSNGNKINKCFVTDKVGIRLVKPCDPITTKKRAFSNHEDLIV